MPNEENILSHHGIKGQKWGARRFQNPDGTLTSEGKIRYGRDGGSRKVKFGADSKGSGANALNTKLKDIDHDVNGNTKRAVTMLMTNVALDVVTLNPIGAAQDIGRIGAAVSAHVREKSAEKRIAKAEIDEKTGLPLKKKVTTPEQDVKMVNPGFRNFNTNTKNNCVLCSTAFELRRRGYDITAKKAGVGYTADEYLKWFKGAKRDSLGGLTLKSSMAMPSAKRSKEQFDWINPKLLSQGEGARGYLSVLWGPGAGHSMAYEVKGGNVVVYDAQSGKKKSLKSITRATVDIGYTRLDNCEPNWAAMRKAGVI